MRRALCLAVAVLSVLAIDAAAQPQRSRCVNWPPKIADHISARACIWQAAKRYGQSYRHALACSRGESGGATWAGGQRQVGVRWWVTNGWDTNAQRGDPSSGLFQIIPSTFATTPYADRPWRLRTARFNALAAMWMWSRGRIGEWAHPAC